MKVTLDTNVLVRLATQDDPAQAAVAMHFLQKASLIAVPTPALCELVWVLLRAYRYTPAQVAHALRSLLQVRQVVCHTPAVLAGLAQLEGGGDFADAAIAFEGDVLGGTEFVSFDQQAVLLLKAQKRKARLLDKALR
ncbi:type II toxin-antitoxin system VapC family toxin [Candidatus Symbiobacter mobilis]|uniref:PIN domain nucleic acid-binding-like protein n=1 Tax=Candidatus Symbiobacter mobilis CR TaxID=946483 RepID=U5NDQ1_9BURK|nr:type II toxin-antitoxin system VapC family toxin [Candidatus Symbiobacter mobilis]AGX88294.1 PIN domain nucleic acid-binding-like protein [Candidatus Symbiobacter mobilis CR]